MRSTYFHQHHNVFFRGMMDRNALTIWGVGVMSLAMLVSLAAWF